MKELENNNTTNIINKIVAILKQIGIIFIFFLLTTTFATVFYKGIICKNFLIGNLAYIVAEMCVLIVFIFIFRKILIPDYYEFKDNFMNYIKDNFKYYIYGFIIMYVSNLILSPIIGMAENQKLIEEVNMSYPIYITVATIIFAPIVEELLTRTILKDAFKHQWIYILISGLIFGAMHISKFNSLQALYIISYGALGCSFAKMYSKTNNIWVSIFYHGLHNTISILMMFILGVLS